MVAMDVFSELASVFDITVGDHSRYYDAIISSIGERYPGLENATMADIGGGTGLFAFRACDRVHSILLVDPSTAMARVAKDKLARSGCDNVEIKAGGFPDSGLGKGSVDIVVVIGTFQYLSAEAQLPALRHIRESLKPGGLAFLDLTNHFAFIGRQAGPGTRQFLANEMKITEKTRHEAYPFREEWIDTYHFTVENILSGEAKEFESRHVLKMISPTGMRLLLRGAGFSSIEVIPQPDVEIEKAEKMWCFAKKLV